MDELEKFNKDIAELSAMVRRSWSSNKQEALSYTETFLQSALTQPGTSMDDCPAIYHNGALVAFGSIFPRQVAVAGRMWKIAIGSLLTVALDYQKWGGLGVTIWKGLTEEGKRQQCDGMISYCVEGDGMDRSLLRIGKYCQVPTQKVFEVRYLARPVPKDRGPLAKADPGILLQCAEQLGKDSSFARVWNEAEAVWQCNDRDGAFGCSMQRGDLEGTISASTMFTEGATPVCCGLVDDILWGDLEHDARKELVQHLLNSASAAGVELLLVPVMNYADTKPFFDTGFRKTRRTLNMYLSAWNPEFPLHELSSAYIDVF